MPAAAAETAATFAGIHNENEFYSHHYLSEVFAGDIRETVEHWREAAADGGSSNNGGGPTSATPRSIRRRTARATGWSTCATSKWCA